MMGILKNRNIDLINKKHVEHIIEEIENQENVDRKIREWDAYQIRTGNQKDFTVKKLKEIYPKTWSKFRISDISLAKKVTKKRSKAYKTQPIRELENSTETEKYQAILKTGKFSRSFKEFDSIFNAHKYALMFVRFINPEDGGGEKGMYFAQSLAPYQYDLIRDEKTGKPLIFILNLPDSEITGILSHNDGIEQAISESQGDTSAETKFYAMWSDERHVLVKVRTSRRQLSDNSTKIEKEVTFVPIPDNAGMVNGFGTLPIAYEQVDTEVDYPTPNNLADQSVEWNVACSDLKTA